MGGILVVVTGAHAAVSNFRILSASIRSNILFSHEYDESFYNLVLDGRTGRDSVYVCSSSNEIRYQRVHLDRI